MMSFTLVLSGQPVQPVNVSINSTPRGEVPQQSLVPRTTDSNPSLTDQQLKYLAFQKARELHHRQSQKAPLEQNTGRFVPIRGELNREMVNNFYKTRIPFYEKEVSNYERTLSLELSKNDREDLVSEFIDTLIDSLDADIEHVFGNREETKHTRLGLRVGVLSTIREAAGVQEYRHVLRKHPELALFQL